MNKSVLIAIQPYYVFLIIARAMGWNIPQYKMVEVRKDCPKDSAWNRRVHIYCSKNRKSFNHIPKQYQPLMEKFLGKVVGEWMCEKIYTINTYQDSDYSIVGYSPYIEDNSIEEMTCLTQYELGQYLQDTKDCRGYGWHISDLKIYDKPKELGAFFMEGECDKLDYCGRCSNFHKGQGWLDGSYCDEDCCLTFGIKPFVRPPQSWAYCIEVSK